MQDYLNKTGQEVQKWYQLPIALGVSGQDHQVWQTLISDIKSGKINCIITPDLSHIAASLNELAEFVELLDSNAVRLISLAENIDTNTKLSWSSYTSVLAKWQHELAKLRGKHIASERAQSGLASGGQAPYGYQWQNGQLAIDPREALVRKMMYELFLTHRRKQPVAKALFREGHTTRKGKAFSITTLDRLLRDPIAIGRRRKYSPLESAMPEWEIFEELRLIDDETWISCNQILGDQRQAKLPVSKRVKHLFAGLVFCQNKHAMYVMSRSKKYSCPQCKVAIETRDLERIFQHELQARSSYANAVDHWPLLMLLQKESDCGNSHKYCCNSQRIRNSY